MRLVRARRSTPPTIEKGLLIIEDLGNEALVEGEPPAPIETRYAAAVDALVALHGKALTGRAADRPAGANIAIPPYDLDAFLIEAELLLDWYLPRIGRDDIARRTRAAFRRAVA